MNNIEIPAPVSSDATRAVGEIQDWLRNELARVFKRPPAQMDLSKSAEELALDSITVVRLAGELEEWLKVQIEPSLIYEYPTLDEFARQLAVQHEREMERRRESGLGVVLRLAATFTAEPVEESLMHVLKKAGLAPDFAVAPYNQVFQELLNPASVLGRNPTGVNLLLVRVEDWFRFEQSPPAEEQVRRVVAEFTAALRTFAARGGRLILGLCPHTGANVRTLGLPSMLDALDEGILEAAGSLPNVYPLDLRDLTSRYEIRRVLDEARDHLGHIPFTPEMFAALGAELGRRVHALLRPPAKVLVVDCDNTLWRGVCGEDGALGVEVTPPFAEFQELLIECQQEGKLICLGSKNNEADAWEVFDRNPGMRLRRSHIVASRINWQRKSENLRSLARELNLGLDSFIFIDDNPAECAEVRSALPEVLVIQLPVDAATIPGYFRHHWAFDASKITAEDRQRTESYQQNRQREAARDTAGSFEEFIRDLGVVTEISPLTTPDIPRAAQLTQRTNQFNATTRRRDEPEMARLMARDDIRVFTVRVRDRFGDYGLVGLLVAEIGPESVLCETFLMSCRVLGKRVEQEMVRHLARLATTLGLGNVRLQYQASEKNRPLLDFYTSLGRPLEPAAPDTQEIRFHPDEAESLLAVAKVEHQLPEATPAKGTATKGMPRLSDLAGALDELAGLRGDAAALLRTIRARGRMKRGQIKTEFIAPRTAWQRKLAAIWSDVLGLDRVGIYDNFFDLGGDSLRAAEAFARMADLGVPQSMSLVNTAEANVASLAQAIEDVKAGRRPRLVHEQFSLRDEGRLPADLRRDYEVTAHDIPMRNVLLTGGTGYLGAFLLHELMRQTEVRVWCLVRASTPAEGRRRLAGNLSRYGLWRDEYHARIEIVPGELSEPRLGIPAAEYTKLANQLDTIFQSGAWVNFVFPYQRLKSAHVEAMENILRLAAAPARRPLALHFISTLGVIMSTGYARGCTVMEDAPLEHVEGLLNGYEQAKHVADKMAWTAMRERGIPVAIYRPGMVGGLGDTGVYHKLDEFLSSFYKGCVQLGAWPLLDSTWEVVPVDFLTRVIVHGARDPRNLNHVYHTLHPDPVPVRDYIQWTREFGYPARALPWEVWKNEVLSQGVEELRASALFPFIDFIRALYEEQVYFPATDKTNFLRLARAAGATCPSQRDVYERYLRHFVKVGYLPAPRAAAATPAPLARELQFA